MLQSKKSVEEKLQDSENKLSGTNVKLDTAKVQITELQTKLSRTTSRAEMEFDEETKRAEQAERKLSMKTKEFMIAQAQNVQLDTKLAKTIRLLEEEKVRTRDLKNQLDLSKHTAKQEFEQLQDVLESVEKENTALEKELEELKRKRVQADEQVRKRRESMNKERELFLQEKSELQASKIELSNQNQKLVELPTLLLSKLWQRDELVANMEQDMQDAHEELLAAVRGDLKFVTRILKNTHKELNEAETWALTAQRDLEKANNEIKKWKTLALQHKGNRRNQSSCQKRRKSRSVSPVDNFLPLEKCVQHSNTSFSSHGVIISSDTSDNPFYFSGSGDPTDEPDGSPIDNRDDEQIINTAVESKDVSSFIADSSVATHQRGNLSIASSFTLALQSDSFFSDEDNILDQELRKLEQQLEKISCWIDWARNEISLPPASSTCNEILDTIGHNIVMKVKQILNELHKLAQKRRSLEEDKEVLIQEYFQDRLCKLKATEKDCERSLKTIQKSASDKIGNAAVSFKKNIGFFMDVYRRDAKNARNEMGILLRRCEEEVPVHFDTVEKAQVAVQNSIRDKEKFFSLKEDVARLKKMGQILGRYRNLQSLDCNDCMYDSNDLEILQDTVCKKLGERTKLLNFRCQQRENEEQWKEEDH